MNEGLQFDHAELPVAAPVKCGGCQCVISAEYYEANGQIFCPACGAGLHEVLSGQGSRAGRFSRALFFGSGAALLSSVIYYAITAATGYQIGLIAIGIGYFVGRAVRRGSGGRGGWRYQVLAALLTYMAIVLPYIPMIFAEASEQGRTKDRTTHVVRDKDKKTAAAADTKGATEPAAASASETEAGVAAEQAVVQEAPSFGQMAFAMVVLVGIAMAAPVLAGFENILGLLIIGFGVWEAWRVNASLQIAVSGPYHIGTRPVVNSVEPTAG